MVKYSGIKDITLLCPDSCTADTESERRSGGKSDESMQLELVSDAIIFQKRKFFTFDHSIHVTFVRWKFKQEYSININ